MAPPCTVGRCWRPTRTGPGAWATCPTITPRSSPGSSGPRRERPAAPRGRAGPARRGPAGGGPAARPGHAEARGARARRLTDQLRGALDLSVELLTTAYRERFDRELGYPSWSDYCRTELPQLAILGKGLPPVERR